MFESQKQHFLGINFIMCSGANLLTYTWFATHFNIRRTKTARAKTHKLFNQRYVSLFIHRRLDNTQFHRSSRKYSTSATSTSKHVPARTRRAPTCSSHASCTEVSEKTTHIRGNALPVFAVQRAQMMYYFHECTRDVRATKGVLVWCLCVCE